MKNMFAVVMLVATSILHTTTQAKSVGPTDSLVVRFANRTRLVIYAPDKASIQALSNYDLNKIVREMGMKLDSVPGGQTTISRTDGDRFLKDTVLVVTKKKDGVTIVINDKGDTTETNARRPKGRTIDRNTDREERWNRKRDSWNIDYGLSLGLNTLLTQSISPNYSEDSYALDPIGSRYIALSAGAMPTIIRGKYASLKLYYGVEVAWNNFMFENNNIADKGPAAVAFTAANRELQKSKLTVCSIGIPVVPRLAFYDSRGRKIGHIGLGGYVNYRLDSYRKIKEADGSKDRRHSDFYLNDLRYGAIAHLGIRSFNFFVKYDLNPLFKDNKGPDVRTLTFGIGF